jgi:hypothetical protein
MQKSILKAKLITLDQSPIPKVFSVGAGESKKIGRNHFPPDRIDMKMSSEHFEIFNDSNRVLIEDLQSANGVSVNDRRIATSARISLGDGDTVQAGNTKFKVVFEYTQDLSPKQPPVVPPNYTSPPPPNKDIPETRRFTSIEGKSVESDEMDFLELRKNPIGGYQEPQNRRQPQNTAVERMVSQDPEPEAEVFKKSPESKPESKKPMYSSIEDSPTDDETSGDSFFEQRLEVAQYTDSKSPEFENNPIGISRENLPWGLDLPEQMAPSVAPSSTPRIAGRQRLRANGIHSFARVLEHLGDDSSGSIYGMVVAHFLKLGTSVPEWIQAKPVFSRMEANPLFLPVIVPLRVWMDQCHQEWTIPLMENDGIVLVVNGQDPNPERQIQKLGSTGIERFSKPNGMLNWCWPSGLKTILSNSSEACIARWLPAIFHGIVFPDALTETSEAIADERLGRILIRHGFSE